MRTVATLALAAVLIAGCATKQGPAAEQQQPAPSASTPPPAKQDVSTETLVKIDPAIGAYQVAVEKAKKKYDAKKDAGSKKELVEAYIAFAKYMTYDSPVTPRQGKYRRALMEFRHALTLDSGNAFVKNEIEQIENIYREMGRPIPSTDEG